MLKVQSNAFFLLVVVCDGDGEHGDDGGGGDGVGSVGGSDGGGGC